MWQTIKHWLWADSTDTADFTTRDAYNEGYDIGKGGRVLFLPPAIYTPGQAHAYTIGNLNALNSRLLFLEGRPS